MKFLPILPPTRVENFTQPMLVFVFGSRSCERIDGGLSEELYMNTGRSQI